MYNKLLQAAVSYGYWSYKRFFSNPFLYLLTFQVTIFFTVFSEFH